MPIFSYFVSVSAALLGLLYIAADVLGAPGPIPNNTSYHTVFKPTPPRDTVQILAFRDAPAPDMKTASFMSTDDALPVTQATGSLAQARMPALHKERRTATKPKKAAVVAQTAKVAPRYAQYSVGRDPGTVY